MHCSLENKYLTKTIIRYQAQSQMMFNETQCKLFSMMHVLVAYKHCFCLLVGIPDSIFMLCYVVSKGLYHTTTSLYHAAD